MIEIPRNITANLWKLAIGVVIVAMTVAVALEPEPTSSGSWIPAVPLVAAASLLIVSNIRLLLTRPPCLRASKDGVWFGGGPTIPWQAIKAVYDGGATITRYGYSVRTRAIGFAFHRKRTVLRLPSFLWLTTFTIGDVKISAYAREEHVSALVFQLDALRIQACGHESGVIAGASEVPAARTLRRR